MWNILNFKIKWNFVVWLYKMVALFNSGNLWRLRSHHMPVHNFPVEIHHVLICLSGLSVLWKSNRPGKSPKTEIGLLGWEWWQGTPNGQVILGRAMIRPPYLCLHPAEWSRSCSCGAPWGWGPQSVQGGQPGGQFSPPERYAHTLVSSYCQK